MTAAQPGLSEAAFKFLLVELSVASTASRCSGTLGADVASLLAMPNGRDIHLYKEVTLLVQVWVEALWNYRAHPEEQQY